MSLDNYDEYILDIYNDLHSTHKNLRLNDDIENKLKKYQHFHVFNMINAIKSNRIVFDSSQTGTGKTYTTVALCKQLGLIPFVICPKSIISKWVEVFKLFEQPFISVSNYEAIRNCKYYDEKENLIECDFIIRKNNNFVWNKDKMKKFGDLNKIVFIFDEVHHCKNYKSLNAKLLLSVYRFKVIMLSATLCDKTNDFAVYGLMLGLYKRIQSGKNWIETLIRKRKNQVKSKKNFNILHKFLIPKYGNQMVVADIGDDFPKNQVNIDAYKLKQSSIDKINKYFDEMEDIEYKDYDKGVELVKLNKLREKIENIKMEIFNELIIEYLEKQKSIVIFVNYKSSFDIICSFLEKNDVECSKIHGGQDVDERKSNIDDFQQNNLRVIVLMIQAGGQSISLHDTNGKFPRVSLISPSYSSIELTQALGRIYRSGVKSIVIQNIIFCDKTKENDIVSSLKKKKNFMKELNDDDFKFQNKSSKLIDMVSSLIIEK